MALHRYTSSTHDYAYMFPYLSHHEESSLCVVVCNNITWLTSDVNWMCYQSSSPKGMLLGHGVIRVSNVFELFVSTIYTHFWLFTHRCNFWNMISLCLPDTIISLGNFCTRRRNAWFVRHNYFHHSLSLFLTFLAFRDHLFSWCVHTNLVFSLIGTLIAHPSAASFSSKLV